MTPQINSFKQAIDRTLKAISESRQQVESITESTLAEVRRLEAEYEQLKQSCHEAIEMVEKLEKESRRARERLLVVNREIHLYGESEMKEAYETAQALQGELGQWQEREVQLRIRRDDVARRVKSLGVTAHEAEILMAKFHNISGYLSDEFTQANSMFDAARLQSLLGIQLLQIQEDERRALAQRLHDGPMQSLASVAMRMQLMETAETSALGAESQRKISEVIGELRQTVFDLRPPLLDDLGLVPTLKRYAQQCANSANLTIRIRLVGLEATLTPTAKVIVFRSVQEALRNVSKHAKANEVDITLTYGSDSLIVQVRDNGCGIVEADFIDLVEAGHLGLATCRQRLMVLGGTLEVIPAQPRGTCFTMRLPLARETVQPTAAR